MTKHTYITTKDYFLTGEVFDLYEAGGVLETSPVPSDLSRYYRADSYISHSDTKNGLIEVLYHRVREIALRQKVRLVKRHCPEAKSLLDVGAGTGAFLLAAKRAGMHVEGVEPNETARNHAKSKGLSLRVSYPDEGEKYDVITLWHVLEHIKDLEADLGRFEKLLSADGTIIIAVPNYQSKDAGYYGKYWAGYDVPRHLWHFSRRGLIRMMENRCWKHVRTHPMWFDAFYVSMLSEKYKGAGKWAMLLKGFVVGLWSNISAVSSREFSSNIFVFKKL